ncbi:phosphoadenosine phosphosulfate reductase family protein [Marichromatium bheemlicum]|uniref:Phosphoadenosine phosphosulfate reductase family protein n=1 Tax=Marichromatium bheemlicum TaxID=365339 RepID=A0ABX1IAS0_9GAMM|nr:phosphoadenosine phosphosulfate reductase family protein [Marichromatium bheemlicum]NKN33460.1 phosphoadenosine phosphosulfate reductase family protein [Marichromatium bheemlicum]
MTDTTDKPTRHLLGLSGGKDSSALAIYLRDRVPEMEYFFADTGAELPETLEYVDLLEDYLGKPIVKLNAERDFEYYLKLNGNFLPTTKTRWCTSELKIRPFEEYVGNDDAITYVAIRADEAHRKGYLSTKPNISARYPFIEDGKNKEDIMDILEQSGLGMPGYYDWGRSRSGCYFCFFQQKVEWVHLAEKYPELFAKAKEYEQRHKEEGRMQTWSQGEYLEDIWARRAKILEEAAQRKREESKKHKKKLIDVVNPDEIPCLHCFL